MQAQNNIGSVVNMTVPCEEEIKEILLEELEFPSLYFARGRRIYFKSKWQDRLYGIFPPVM